MKVESGGIGRGKSTKVKIWCCRINGEFVAKYVRVMVLASRLAFQVDI